MDFSDMTQAELSLMEAFLEESLGSHQPKMAFQASLKDRLTHAKPVDRRQQLAKAWLAGLACALGATAVYSLGYLIYRRRQARA